VLRMIRSGERRDSENNVAICDGNAFGTVRHESVLFSDKAANLLIISAWSEYGKWQGSVYYADDQGGVLQKQ